MVFLLSSTESRRGHATMKTNQISNAHAPYGKTTSGRPSFSLPSWILRSLVPTVKHWARQNYSDKHDEQYSGASWRTRRWRIREFCALGSYISRSGSMEVHIRAKLGKDLTAYNMLGIIWKYYQFNSKTKINTLSLMLYGFETWWIIQAKVEKLHLLLHISLHCILNIYWTMRVTNEESQIRAEIKPISKQVARRRWKWPSHVLRINHHLHFRITLTWLPEKK